MNGILKKLQNGFIGRTRLRTSALEIIEFEDFTFRGFKLQLFLVIITQIVKASITIFNSLYYPNKYLCICSTKIISQYLSNYIFHNFFFLN